MIAMPHRVIDYIAHLDFAYVFLLGSTYAIGGASNELVNHVKGGASWHEMIMGPLGALALSLGFLILVLRYFNKRDKLHQETNEKLIQEYKNHIQSLRDIINKGSK